MLFELPDPPNGPATRRAIHEYFNRAGYKVSYRTVERLPIPYKIVNGRATSTWPIVAAYLREVLEDGPLHNAATLERLRRKIPSLGTAA